MSYIRGALPFLIYNPNTRDDILPDGSKTVFELSQEVPGGYEGNVQVFRRQYLSDVLVTSSIPVISFVARTPAGDPDKIVCTTSTVAAALSVVNAGDAIYVSGANSPQNNGRFFVEAVEYDGLIITLSGTPETAYVDEDYGASVSLIRKYVGPWEVLDGEIDYTIGGTDEKLNRLIIFSEPPQEEDTIYVVHRGEATYNFVPTEKTVGPEQLQDNLRNFRVDLFSGDGSTTEFTLSQFAVNARTLEVSVNGVVKYGNDTDSEGNPFVGDFSLIGDGMVIQFASAPANGAKIYVRHLGFSTVSRRETLTPSQLGSLAPGSVKTIHLANTAVTEPKIATSAVTNTKIAPDAVTGSKILLNNGEWLRWKSATSPFGPLSVLRLDSANNVSLRTPGNTLSLEVNNDKTISFSSIEIKDATGTGQVNLGSAANKFKDAHFSGALNAESASITGNITVGGTVDSVDIAALKAQVDALSASITSGIPAGFITMWAKNEVDAFGNLVPPPGYLMCDGRPYLKADYPALFAVLGGAFGETGTTFNVPDFRGRFPLGKTTGSGTGSGWGLLGGRGGSLDHKHGLPSHTHGLNNHTHTVFAHSHGMADGATLNILSSGTHTTSLSHTHTGGQTNAGLTEGTFEVTNTEGSFEPLIGYTNLSITSYQGSGTTDVIGTTSNNHGLVVGDVIRIAGASRPELNGSWKIYSRTSTSFIFTTSAPVPNGLYTTNIGTTIKLYRNQLGHKHKAWEEAGDKVITSSANGSHTHSLTSAAACFSISTENTRLQQRVLSSTYIPSHIDRITLNQSNVQSIVTDVTQSSTTKNITVTKNRLDLSWQPETGPASNAYVALAGSTDLPAASTTTSTNGVSHTHSHTVTLSEWYTAPSANLVHIHRVPPLNVVLPASTVRAVDASGNIINSSNSISDGAHAHPSSSITGKIGKVTGGQDGDVNTQSDGPSTADTTGPNYGSGVSAESESSNPPFQTIHFIIKT